MNSWSWNRGGKFESPAMELRGKGQYIDLKATTTTVQTGQGPCLSSGHRRCADGSCIARVDLCPEEQMMNQNTVLIMIVVGMAVVIFLIILYCFQQRSHRLRRNNSTSQGAFESVAGDGDNASLNMPPPTYEEVVTTNRYPSTPVLQRNNRISSSEEPRTPPPNYDTALHILAHSHDSMVPVKVEARSPVVRRSVSSELGGGGSGGARVSQPSDMEYRRLFSSPDHR